MIKMYIKQSIWDLLITSCLGMSLAYSLMSCFYVSPTIQYGPVPGIIVVVYISLLLTCSINRRIIRIGIPLYVLALVIAWVVSAVMSKGPIFADAESNALIYVMVSTLSATGAFLLSRTRLGTAILFIAGVVILALIQFLYLQYDLIWMIAFVVSSITSIIYRNYLCAMRNADSLKSANFPAGFIVALATSLLSVGLGAAVWFGIIAPLSPGAFQIKLISETKSLEMVLARGVSSVYMTPDTSLTSDKTNQDVRTTDDIKEDPSGIPTPANGTDSTGATKSPNNAGSFLGQNIDSPDDLFDLSNYDLRTYALMALAIALVLGIVLYFVFRRQNRMFRLMWMRNLGMSKEAPALYKTIMAKFKKLGIEPAPGQTLTDFAKANEEHLRYFNEASNESFSDITTSYVRSVYGAVPFNADDIIKLEKYYSAFWKGAFKHLGPVKYFFKSFRI